MTPPAQKTRRLAPILLTLVAMAAAGPVLAAAFVYSGAYDIGADAPHTQLVFSLISELRDRSIVTRAKAITPPPDLETPDRIAAGAEIYGGVCKTCHLAPGMGKTDTHAGLYPRPPQLAYGDALTPAQQFWVIKHGLKMTGMPAWGRSYQDEEIWDLVAFIRKMPGLTPDQYRAAVKGEPIPPSAPPAR